MKIKDRPEFRSKPAAFTLRAGDTAVSAIRTMADRNIGSVVIIDDDRMVKGIVTERDLLRRLLGQGLDPAKTPLSAIMTNEVRTASPDDELLDWLRQMSNDRFRHLPVVDAEGRLINLMSQGDLVSYTWPDLFAHMRDMTRESLKGGRSQLPILIGAMAAYAIAVLVLVKLLWQH